MIAQAAKKVLQRLEANGFHGYVVGGCVRDLLLGKAPHDWDVCTSATPSETLELFKGEHVIETGLKHGTVTVFMDGAPIEVTTFRTDGLYSDGRRPDEVRFVTSLGDDLSRRDFTINAMAMDLNGVETDLYGGKQDLQSKLIRCVGDADTRFKEDALRILRALRFASVLGFDVESETRRSIHQNKERLKKVSVERVAVEITKMLMGENVLAILLEFADVLAVVLPEIRQMIGFDQHNPYHLYDVWIHTAHAVAAAKKDPVILWTMLLHDVGKPLCYHMDAKGIGHFYGHAHEGASIAKAMLKRLKLDKKTISQVETLVYYHDRRIAKTPAAIKKCLRLMGRELFEMLLDVQIADDRAKAPHKILIAERENLALRALYEAVIQTGECFSLKDLAVTGDDLIGQGLKGKEVGETLEALLTSVIKGDVKNERGALIGMIDKG